MTKRASTAHLSGQMVFEAEPFALIRATVGTERVESGGILLGSREDYVVRKFVYDPHGSKFTAGYDPDVTFLNKVIKEEWNNNQLALLGFVHSHPRGIRRLSGDWGNGIGDIGYLRKIFSAIPALEKFLVPIVYSTADGGPFELFPYVAVADHAEDYQEAALIVRELASEVENTIPTQLGPPTSNNGLWTVSGPISTINTYRTQDGEAYFTFRFIQANNSYEADIIDMPSYGTRDDSLFCTHRTRSPRGGYQANLYAPAGFQSVDSIRRMVAIWSEMTWRYIQQDERF